MPSPAEQSGSTHDSGGGARRLENSRQAVTTEAKGVLNPAQAAQKFRLARFQPADDLKSFVEHFWIVAWDLRGEPPFFQKVLPYPCVHLVFNAGETAIFGVMRGAYEHKLEDRRAALGVRFRPGGFRGILGSPIATITDKTLPLSAAYATDTAAIEAAVLSAGDDVGMMEAAESLLRTRIPAEDANVTLVNEIVDRIAADRTLNRVDALAPLIGLSERALQRLFVDYVGVSPKWVIRRSRLHDAASRLANDEDVNLTHLAQELGYSDQAHFTRDFKVIAGRSPSDYRRVAAT